MCDRRDAARHARTRSTDPARVARRDASELARAAVGALSRRRRWPTLREQSSKQHYSRQQTLDVWRRSSWKGGRRMIRPRSKERALRTAMLDRGRFRDRLGRARRDRRAAPPRQLRVHDSRCCPPEKFALDAAMVILFGASLIAALALSGFYHHRVDPRTRPSIHDRARHPDRARRRSAAPRWSARCRARSSSRCRSSRRWRCRSGGGCCALVAPIRPRDTILVGEPRDIEEALAVCESHDDRRIQVIKRASRLDQLADPATQARSCATSRRSSTSRPNADPRLRLELLRIRGPRGFLMLASHVDALLASTNAGMDRRPATRRSRGELRLRTQRRDQAVDRHRRQRAADPRQRAALDRGIDRHRPRRRTPHSHPPATRRPRRRAVRHVEVPLNARRCRYERRGRAGRQPHHARGSDCCGATTSTSCRS